jgi:hypothetical protein
MRAILQCDPVGPCMGYEGDCGDYQTQFAGVQGAYFFSDGPGEEPTEHEYIDDYVCHAFPDDAYVTDQFFVGLISVAVALPVDLFLARAFEIANEGDVPENWIDAPPGKWKLLLGKDMHNGWHLADPAKPVSDFILWLIGEQAEDFVSSLLMLPVWLLGRLRGRCAAAKPQWGAEQGENEDEKADQDDAQSSGGGSSHASADARADALRKRLYASAGLIGVYVCWTIFSWCACGQRCVGSLLARGLGGLTRRNRPVCAVPPTRFIFTYGMLIYKQLGADAQNEFAKTWGVGYALNNASEWQDVAITACKAAVLIVILDALRFTKNASWFEEHGACAFCAPARLGVEQANIRCASLTPPFLRAVCS